MTAVEIVTPALLRGWPLPKPGDSKDFRGRLLVIGGSRKVPGAAQLAGLAAMRVGAGVLTLAVAESVAAALAVATPEAGVVGLAEDANGSVTGSDLDRIASDVEAADAVLVGPGLDQAGGAKRVLRELVSLLPAKVSVSLDAFALGVLPDVWPDVKGLAGRLVLTPNSEEAGRLLDRELEEISGDDVREIADRYGAVVSCQQWIAEPAGGLWRGSSGHGGLGTSGSGDVLAGAIAGLLTRGVDRARAACWGSHLHATAGDRLAIEVGPVGFLAGELVARLPLVMAEISTS